MKNFRPAILSLLLTALMAATAHETLPSENFAGNSPSNYTM